MPAQSTLLLRRSRQARSLLATFGVALLLTGCQGNEPAAGSAASAPAPAGGATRSPEPSATASTGGVPQPTAPGGPELPAGGRLPQESPPPPGLPGCSAADLTVTDADSLVTPETWRQVFAVRTQGPDCQFRGFPEVSLLRADGTPLAVTVRDSGFDIEPQAPETVTLSRSTSVSFVLGTPRSGDCVAVATVEAVLPGADAPVRAATTLEVCDGRLARSPVLRRAGQD